MDMRPDSVIPEKTARAITRILEKELEGHGFILIVAQAGRGGRAGVLGNVADDSAILLLEGALLQVKSDPKRYDLEKGEA